MEKRQEKILFVLVICGCRVEDSTSFKTLVGPDRGNVADLFVYDNTSALQHTSLPVAEYVHDPDNSGLSKAYNTACEFAESHGYRWLLLLDQDTEFPPGALEAYRRGMARIQPGIEMIVPRHQVANGLFMSPTRYRMKTSRLQREAPTGVVRFSDASPINSGMLVSVKSFRRAGGYENAVWLDFSDVCFIERYKVFYPRFYVLPDVICRQSFSAMETDAAKVYRRYCIYLECARNYPRRSLLDSIALTVTTLRPTLSRTVREKTLKYLKAYWNIYL